MNFFGNLHHYSLSIFSSIYIIPHLLLADESQVIDYFEARQAVIGNLEVKGTLHSPKMKADIAYHFDVRPKEFQQILTEGDVVGLNANADGETSLIELSAKNMSTITQAGVISRSAFFEGNIPDQKGSIP